MKRFMKSCVWLAAAVALTAGAAQAVTATDGDVDRAAWDAFKSPTAISSDVTRIEGRGAAGDQDHFLFEGLSRGSQTFRIVFEAPEGIGNSYSAGGVVKWQDGPFQWSAWEGEKAGSFQLDLRKGAVAELAFDLGRRFRGGLMHLALLFTHGQDVSYVISAPERSGILSGAARVDPVAPRVVATPLPAGAALLLTAMAAAAGLRLRRRAG